MWCSVLQRVAACCSVVQFVAVQVDYTLSCRLGEGNGGGAQVSGAVCCSVLQCVAVCCSVLQCRWVEAMEAELK